MGRESYAEITIDGITYRFPEHVYYSADGLWVALDGGLGRVGVGDYLCRSVSASLNFIHPRKPGTSVKQGEEIGSFDLVKVDVPISSPVTGVIQEINEELMSNLWLLDSDPYGDGWLALVRLTDFSADRENLMDAEAYLALLRQLAKPSPADDRRIELA